MILEIIILLLSYLFGAIPFGFLLTKKYAAKNILELGSGNIGSSNVRRIAGKKLSLITQVLDMAKGFLPVLMIKILEAFDSTLFSKGFIFYTAFASILGHNFSIFLKFKGGKGVNTTLGSFLLLTPLPVVTAGLVHLLVKKISPYVSVASLALSLSLPLSGVIFYGLSYEFFSLLLCCLLLFLRHTPNIKRLLAGSELYEKVKE
ncbi:MAG: glycerol-3-phosphate 1-O-acyltransferase PlsY [Oligoflexia bacterium]|nr:glycerol-3-phosphate 1-O-acyltransferase PlsY [Oligoflexia bacterium]MBF0367512.1 glycerol-3-phosphate 1-O-acyltransferase PlsY [Oligoflexia bacterium]